MIKRKLIRSKSLVDSMGHNTWRYRWTECFYIFGFLIRSIQVNNLSYMEAYEVFGPGYKNSLFANQREHEKQWFETIVYTTNKEL